MNGKNKKQGYPQVANKSAGANNARERQTPRPRERTPATARDSVGKSPAGRRTSASGR